MRQNLGFKLCPHNLYRLQEWDHIRSQACQVFHALRHELLDEGLGTRLEITSTWRTWPLSFEYVQSVCACRENKAYVCDASTSARVASSGTWMSLWPCRFSWYTWEGEGGEGRMQWEDNINCTQSSLVPNPHPLTRKKKKTTSLIPLHCHTVLCPDPSHMKMRL